MKSLIVVGESKSLTSAGDSKKSLIVEDKKTLLTAWGLKIFDYGEREILGPLLGIENPLATVGESKSRPMLRTQRSLLKMRNSC